MNDVDAICEFVDTLMDDYSKTKKKSKTNFFKYFESANYDRKTINEYVSEYSFTVTQQIKELDGALTGDKNLAEAYGQFNKSELRDFISMLQKFLEEANRYKDYKKITRRKKQKTPEQLVKGLHLIEESVIIEDVEYEPVDKTKIIDATSIFLVNVKTKDLLFLSGNKLSCSGAKITGYNPNISGVKKLKRITESINSVTTSNKLACQTIFENLPNKRRPSPKTVSPNYILLKVLT